MRLVVSFLLLLVLTIPGATSAQPLPERIDAILNGANVIDNRWTVLIENADGSAEYYRRNPNTPLTPASVTKLYTTAAGFGLLGPDYVWETNIYRTGTRTGGTIDGDLVLFGEHDPTWNTSVFSGNARAGLNFIAGRLRNQVGITSVTGQVRVIGATFYNLGSTNTGHANIGGSQGTMNTNTANAFRDALQAAGVTIGNTTAVGTYTFTLPAGSTLLYTHHSNDLSYQGKPLTLEVASIPLNRVSHNVMADFMLRHIGYRLNPAKPDTYAAGAAFTVPFFSGTVGLNTTGLAQIDGSGLSHSNKFTARQTVDLIRYMVNAFPTWRDTLSLNCTSGAGTIASRICGLPGGSVLAKTGSLSTTISLAGLVVNPTDGEEYFFAMLSNRPSINQASTRAAIDAAVTLLGERLIPISPEILSIQQQAANVLRVDWTDPTLTTNAYHISASNDGTSYFPLATVLPVHIIETRAGGQNIAQYSDSPNFENSTSHSTAPGTTPGIGSRFLRPTSGTGQSRFTPAGLPEGRYRVDVTCYNVTSAYAPGTTVRIVDRNGDRTAQFDLSDETAGDFWRSVATIDYIPGQNHFVEFSNAAQLNAGADHRMNPAAVRLTPLFFVDSSVPIGTRRHYRVTVEGPRGLQSKLSRTYAARADATPARVLVVDGNNRWRTDPENPLRINHDFGAITARAIGLEWGNDIAWNEAVRSGHVNLADYEAVVWALGEEGSVDRTFDSVEQALVTDYLVNQRGALFVTGSELGWDLDRPSGPSAADRNFIRNVLRILYVKDSSGTTLVTPVAGGLYDGIGGFNFSSGAMDVQFPDVFDPGTGGVLQLRYTSLTDGAGVSYRAPDQGYGVIGFGFPLSMVSPVAAREEIMQRSLYFLLRPLAPEGFDATPGDGVVHLDWDPPVEADVVSWNVYRRVGAQDWQLVNPSPVLVTAYSDATVLNGIAYTYAVSAVDATDNEGPLSASVLVTPEGDDASVRGWILF